MKEKVSLQTRLAQLALAICVVEGVFIGYVLLNSPKAYPQIAADQSEVEVVSEARRIHREFVEEFPAIPGWFSPGLPYMSTKYSAYGLLVDPGRHADVPLETRVRNYNNALRDLYDDLYGSLYVLLSAFLAGALASVLIWKRQFVWLSTVALILASLITTPPFTEVVINLDSVFLFYWTLPLLILGVVLLFLEFKQSKAMTAEGRQLSVRALAIRQLFWGVGLIGIGVVVSILSFSLSSAAGGKTFVVAAGPAIYGLVLSGAALYRLIKG